MLKRFLSAIILAVLGVLVWGNFTQAGFGISPPYVKTSNPIFPGSHYEQKITLLRSSAEEDLQAEVSVNAPEIDSWVSINKGEKFDLPKGKLQVPMIVMVDVPKSAEIGHYKGYINIRIVPKEKSKSTGVAIALGARIDIDLDVTNKEFIDFLVRRVDVPDFEILGRPWNWKIFSYFFYRVKVVMKIENTGNVKVAPTRVHIDIYDLTEKNLLESHDDKSIKKINPFETHEVTASFPTDLSVGQYWAKVKIYKDKDIVYKDKIAFSVVSSGNLPGGTKLGIWPWLMLSGMIAFVLVIIFILIKIKSWRYLFKALFVISWPLRFIWSKIKSICNKIKLKFWKWMHKKSSRYQREEDDNNEK